MIHMYGTWAGFRTDLVDLSNWPERFDDRVDRQRLWAHPLHAARRAPDEQAPYAFRPGVLDRQIRAGDTWSGARRTNVAMSDEIGHFENCLRNRRELQLRDTRQSGSGRTDEDDGNKFCVPGTDSTLGDDRWMLRVPMPTMTGSRTQMIGPVRIATSSLTGRCIRRRCCSRAHLRTGGRTTRRSRSRPTCRASRPTTLRTTRRSVTRRPARTASIRQTGRSSIRSSRPACERARVRGRREVISSRAPRATSAAARRPSSARRCGPYPEPGFTTELPVQQFQQRGQYRTPAASADRRRRRPRA